MSVCVIFTSLSSSSLSILVSLAVGVTLLFHFQAPSHHFVWGGVSAVLWDVCLFIDRRLQPTLCPKKTVIGKRGNSLFSSEIT